MVAEALTLHKQVRKLADNKFVAIYISTSAEVTLTVYDCDQRLVDRIVNRIGSACHRINTQFDQGKAKITFLPKSFF